MTVVRKRNRLSFAIDASVDVRIIDIPGVRRLKFFTVSMPEIARLKVVRYGNPTNFGKTSGVNANGPRIFDEFGLTDDQHIELAAASGNHADLYLDIHPWGGPISFGFSGRDICVLPDAEVVRLKERGIRWPSPSKMIEQYGLGNCEKTIKAGGGDFHLVEIIDQKQAVIDLDTGEFVDVPFVLTFATFMRTEPRGEITSALERIALRPDVTPISLERSIGTPGPHRDFLWRPENADEIRKAKGVNFVGWLKKNDPFGFAAARKAARKS